MFRDSDKQFLLGKNFDFKQFIVQWRTDQSEIDLAIGKGFGKLLGQVLRTEIWQSG